MSTPATEVADFIQQFVKQQESYQGACFRLTGQKGYHSVESGARHQFIIGLVIDLDDKTVRMDITKGHYVQALAPLHQYVLSKPCTALRPKPCVALCSTTMQAVIAESFM